MAYSGHNKALFLVCLRHYFYNVNFGGIHLNIGDFMALPWALKKRVCLGKQAHLYEERLCPRIYIF